MISISVKFSKGRSLRLGLDHSVTGKERNHKPDFFPKFPPVKCPGALASVLTMKKNKYFKTSKVVANTVVLRLAPQ